MQLEMHACTFIECKLKESDSTQVGWLG